MWRSKPRPLGFCSRHLSTLGTSIFSPPALFQFILCMEAGAIPLKHQIEHTTPLLEMCRWLPTSPRENSKVFLVRPRALAPPAMLLFPSLAPPRPSQALHMAHVFLAQSRCPCSSCCSFPASGSLHSIRRVFLMTFHHEHCPWDPLSPISSFVFFVAPSLTTPPQYMKLYVWVCFPSSY